MDPKLFILGLDGATFDLLQPWAEDGKLPHFKALMENGCRGELRSTIHPLSPPAWTSFMTGKNPGKHGIFDFVVHRPGSYELLYTNGALRRGKTFWRILSEAGKRVVVINVPMTYPPESINGVMISGSDAPGVKSTFTYPPELFQEIMQHIGEYILRDYPHHTDPASYLQQIHRLIDVRKRTLHYFLDTRPWDVFVAVFSAIDLAQHFYWHYMDPSSSAVTEGERAQFGGTILGIYQRMDTILGELLERLPPEATLIVMSDHGAGPVDKVVFLDQWLLAEGFLAYREPGFPAAPLPSVLKALHLGIKRHLHPQKIEWLVRRFPRLRQRVKTRLDFAEIDWRRTKAYSFGRESASIYINLKGRCPQGIVEPGIEYEELCREISARLKELRDPENGEQVVERVYRREEVYHGEYLDLAPDLLISWRDGRYTCRPGYRSRHMPIFESGLVHSEASEVSTLQKGGTHREMGIFLARGPLSLRGRVIQGARLIDLFPTILWLFDLPIPADVDGRVLEEIFPPEVGQKPPQFTTPAQMVGPSEGAVYSEEEASEIAERLKGLGYL